MTDDRLLIHALADHELSEEERKTAEDHLAECASCRAEYEAVNSLKTVLQTRLETADTQASWARCRKRLDELDRSAKVESFVTRYAWGFCSLFLVIILSAAVLNHTLGRNSLQTADVAQMASGLIPLPGPRSQAPSDLRSWLNHAVGDSVPMNLRPHVMQVLQAARGFRDGHQILRLDLLDRAGVMTLFVISNADSVDGLERMDGAHDYFVGKMGKMNCVAWSDRGSAMLVLGERPISALCTVADEIGSK